MAKTPPAPPKGTRDWLPRDLVVRNRVFGLLRDTFERFGFEPLETPAVELTSVLEGKYGEEGDRLLFRVLRRGQELESAASTLCELPSGERTSAVAARTLADMAMRYDLTVPFARVVAAHLNELQLPFRRYQIQPVWRADRPQRGRYREFFQCDVDCVGSRSVTVEAEMLAMVNEVFSALGFRDFTIRINHRGLLDALIERANVPGERRVAALTTMDKLDKIGRDGVRAELEKAGLDASSTDLLMRAIGITGAPGAVIEALRPLVGDSAEGAVAVQELEACFGYLAAMGVPDQHVAFDISVIRGLSYYTGIIYETVAAGAPVGSLASGGRYDRLVGMFLGRDLPCVGISFGVDRMFDAMALLGLLNAEAATTTQALVTLFSGDTVEASFGLAAQLRAAGIRTEVYAEPKELRPQLSFASKKGIPLALILGPDEMARGEVTLRDLRAGTQRAVPLVAAVEAVRDALDASTAQSPAAPIGKQSGG